MSGQQRARQERGARIEQRGVRGFEQVGLRVHSGELRGLDQGVEERRDLGPALGARAVVIFAADDQSSVIPPMSCFAPACITDGIRRAVRTLMFNPVR